MVLGSLLAVDRNQSDVPAESWSHCFSPLTWTQVGLSAAVFWMDAQQPATFFHFLLSFLWIGVFYPLLFPSVLLSSFPLSCSCPAKVTNWCVWSVQRFSLLFVAPPLSLSPRCSAIMSLSSSLPLFLSHFLCSLQVCLLTLALFQLMTDECFFSIPVSSIYKWK